MSRWSDDPEAAAAALVIGARGRLDLAGRVLVCGAHGRLVPVLQEHGLDVTAWNRRVGVGMVQPEPPDGTFDVALLRLAKSKAELEMTAHLVVARLRPGGILYIYGGNDEGVRSAAKRLASLSATFDTVVVAGHGRILMARRPEMVAHLRPRLADWRQVLTHNLDGLMRPWVSYPGLFAGGALDAGTRLLLAHRPAVAGRAVVLDYGCGTGLIAAHVRGRAPEAEIDLLDADSVALVAAAENVPGARVILGDRLAAAGRRSYDLILSNPPIHSGIAEDHAVLERFIRDAPARLRPRGQVILVVQRRVPVETIARATFKTVTVLADDGRFRVWSAQN